MAFVEEKSIKHVKALLTLQSLWNFWLVHFENPYYSVTSSLLHTIQHKYWRRLKNYRPQERWSRWEWRLGWHCPYRSTGTRTSHITRPVRTNIIRTFSVTIHWSLLSPYDPKALRPYAKVWISWGSGEEISELISLAAYSWNRIKFLRLPGIGLPCVGWYKAYLEIRSPWGRRRQWPRNLICRALTDWGPIPGTTSLLQCGFFNVPQNSCMNKDCETGPTG